MTRLDIMLGDQPVGRLERAAPHAEVSPWVAVSLDGAVVGAALSDAEAARLLVRHHRSTVPCS
jgi:hypothetical protein